MKPFGSTHSCRILRVAITWSGGYYCYRKMKMTRWVCTILMIFDYSLFEKLFLLPILNQFPPLATPGSKGNMCVRKIKMMMTMMWRMMIDPLLLIFFGPFWEMEIKTESSKRERERWRNELSWLNCYCCCCSSSKFPIHLFQHDWIRETWIKTDRSG